MHYAMIISAGVNYRQISTRLLSSSSLRENYYLLFFATAEVSLKAVGFAAMNHDKNHLSKPPSEKVNSFGQTKLVFLVPGYSRVCCRWLGSVLQALPHLPTTGGQVGGIVTA